MKHKQSLEIGHEELLIAQTRCMNSGPEMARRTEKILKEDATRAYIEIQKNNNKIVEETKSEAVRFGK